MVHIDAYSFGSMVINGKNYTKDVIIFPDGAVSSPWWRKQGHILTREDLRELLATEPEVLVCGTGAMGVMRPDKKLQEFLTAENIEFIAERSGQAVEIYNDLSGRKKVGGCFHLTC